MRRKPYYLLILILLMCIGFAAVTTSLIINGTASIGQSDFDVYFSEVIQNIFGQEFSGDVIVSPDKKSISFNTDKLSGEDDTFAMGYTVENASGNYDANVTFNIKFKSGEELKDLIRFVIYKVDNYSGHFREDPTELSNNDTFLISAGENAKFAFLVGLTQPVLDEHKIEMELSYTVTPVERTSYVDLSGREEVESYFNLEPGLYTLNKEQTKTWQELIDEGVIHVEDDKLSTNLVMPVDGEITGDSGSIVSISTPLPGDIKPLPGFKKPRASRRNYDSDEKPLAELTEISNNNSSCQTLTGMLVVDENITSIERNNLACIGLKAIVLKNTSNEDIDAVENACPVRVLYTKNQYVLDEFSNEYIPPTYLSALNPVIEDEYAINPNNSSELYAYLGNEEEIIIPEKFTSISKYPFYMTPAKTVNIPDSVKNIDYVSLYGVNDAYYHGEATYNDEVQFWGAKYLNRKVDGDFIIGGKNSDILIEYTGEDKNIVIPEGVRAISDYCFESKELESVKLPSTLEEIGYEAFQYTGLTLLEVPSSVTKIAEDAFYDIKTVIYDGPAICDPDYSDNWGADELYGSKDDDFVYTNGGKTIIKYLGTSKNVIIPEGVTNLGPKLFYEIELDSLQLPSTLEEIGYEALEDTHLKELKVPNSVTKIADDAFYGIESVEYDGPAICDPDYSDNWGAEELYGTKDENFKYKDQGKTIVKYIGESKDVVVPEGVTKLGKESFYEIELDSLILPSTLVEIGYEALEDTDLTELVVPDSVTKIEYDAFYDIDKVIYNGPAICEGSKLWGADELYGTKDENFAYTNNGKYIVDYIGESEDIVVPEGVIGILYGAFNFSIIHTIQLPNSLQYIGTEVFNGTDLISLDVPSTVVQIDKDAFLGVGYINYNGPAKYDDDNNKYWGAKGLNAIIENSFILSKDRSTLLGYVGKEVDIVIPNGVLKIEDKAFYCKKLNSVVIPSSVQIIGAEAFSGTGLKQITVPDTVMMIGKDAFNEIEVLIYNGGALPSYSNNWGAKYRNAVIDGDYMYSIDRKIIISYLGTSKDVVIPDEVTTIGANAFKSITLNSVTIPSSVTSIRSYAFAYTGLSEIDVPDTVTSIGEHAFNNIQILKYNGTASYGSSDKYWGAQYMNASINDLFIISDDGKTLEKYIGSATRNIVIPNGIEVISDRAFYSKTIHTVSIPSSVTTIGDYAFKFYIDQKLELPSSVINIGSHAFGDLYNLVYNGTATYDSDDEYWGALVMNGGYKEGDFLYTDSSKTKVAKYTGGYDLDVVVPEGVIEIKHDAFSFKEINSISLSSSLITIGKQAFYWTKTRNPIIIPGTVTTIGDSAFQYVGAIEYQGTLASNDNWGARSLNPYMENSFAYEDSSKKTLLAYIGTDKNIIVPDTVENIGKYAFYYIDADTIELPNSLINIEYEAFIFAKIPVLTIPSSVTEIKYGALGFYEGNEVVLPSTIEKIGNSSFHYSYIKKVNIPSSVIKIGTGIFSNSEKIEEINFEVKEGWKVQKGSETINISSADMNDMSKVIDYMTNKYKDYTWIR